MSKKKLVGALEATFKAQMTRKMVRMFVLTKSWMSLNLKHLGSKTRSVSQITAIPCGLSKGNISRSTDLKFGQNVCLAEGLEMFEFWLLGVIIDLMVFYAAFNINSFTPRQQLTLIMSFLYFTSTRLGLISVMPKDTPMKNSETLIHKLGQ